MTDTASRLRRAREPRAAFAPWDPRLLPGAFSVEESARRIGAYAWTEQQLFQALGGWVATIPELDVKILFGRHCYHHAWHARLFRERLPELREVNPDRASVPANEGMQAFIEALTEPEGPDLTIEKMVGLYRVLLPRLVTTYSVHAGETSPITDAPTLRTLDLILRDDMADWTEGEAVLQTLLRTPADVDRARARQAEVEGLLIAAGGITGNGPPVGDPRRFPSLAFRPVGT